ncbi:helix-turn-helix transcriptional regulator [Sphaerotilus montanus]|uniref:Transcriptional regulator with XRE-family HTH domain n=1 Tax=Sphaerotilus montanus TaxID=522889 RepID=A0A7Y9QYY0_9BURK|nr:helix-turn-helix transcriptional regulator [Sphaerotilus montanus]NYG33436.1 transcriptional regulator with XRE-family HTH domain [Sphaerotilus montanus]NZD58138.1 helix-turn-helix transcriptional regulator [Sphaerotilus montanus]
MSSFVAPSDESFNIDALRALIGNQVSDKDSLCKLIGQRIRIARESTGLSGHLMAVRIGHASGTQLSLWEMGIRMPPLWSLILLAAETGVSLDYLAGVSDEMAPDPSVAMRRSAVSQARLAIDAVARLVADASIRLSCEVSAAEHAWRHVRDDFAELVTALKRVRDQNGTLFDEHIRGGARLLAAADRISTSVANLERAATTPARLRTEIQASAGAFVAM